MCIAVVVQEDILEVTSELLLGNHYRVSWRYQGFSTIPLLGTAKVKKHSTRMAFSLRLLLESKGAAELNLGDDFENDTCLSNAEVAIILDKQKVNYIEQKKMFTSMFKKTQSYVLEQKTQWPTKPLLSSFVSTALQSLSFEHDDEVHQLEEFEIASLSNLNPEEVEEAVALIPSLPKHFTDHEIEEMLSLISRLTAQIFH
ncbi:hypothetical protein JG687_00000031 [Phytophthora cactorum]|uniref:RNA polymerase Rpb4/RPC9 core domain-containing protein n=1 Tax=Phytophthora cactorum TaxID=29920 RepID=A0A8T1V4P8_9STRA|nr:hypothetical protein JG687_00000031 [Phytophthora cactorum]